MLMTVKEFAEMHHLPNAVANSVIQFLLKQGAITKTDEVRRKNEKGGGRSSIVYAIRERAVVNLLVPAKVVEQETETIDG